MRKPIKLSEHKGAQCHVLISEDGNRIQFISYTTLVLDCKAISDGGEEYIINCIGTYSQTTRKQIGWFLREYFNNLCYYDVKNAYEHSEPCLGYLNDSKMWLF